VAQQLDSSPRCTGEWGLRQRNGEKQRGGASELGFDDSLCTMRIRVAGARGATLDRWAAVVSRHRWRGRSWLDGDESGAVRCSRLLSLAWRASERGMQPVAEWALGHFQWNWARRCSSGPVGHRGLARLPFFFYSLLSNKFQSSDFKNTNHFLT
jgi:hypothetical protein